MTPEVVYHSVHKELEEQGVIYTDIEQQLAKYGDMLKEYFMTLITVNDHKSGALHGAVWLEAAHEKRRNLVCSLKSRYGGPVKTPTLN